MLSMSHLRLNKLLQDNLSSLFCSKAPHPLPTWFKYRCLQDSRKCLELIRELSYLLFLFRWIAEALSLGNPPALQAHAELF